MIVLLLLLLLIILCYCNSIPLKVKLFTSLSVPSSVLSSVPSSVEITKPLKLPVWPVYSGVVMQICDWLGLNDLTEAIVSKIGGRVIPITLANNNDPFLLLVHHAHSFMPFDPIRPLQKLFIQEGFPAHSHSGFDTVTITVESGLRHRDDEGLIQSYNGGDIQWMRAGRGMIHEEMWDLEESNKNNHFKKIELFQLWVNLPAARKDDHPIVNLIKADELKFVDIDKNIKVQVICGDVTIHNIDTESSSINGPGNNMCESNISIMQAQLGPNAELIINAEPDVVMTCFVRRGSLISDNEEVIFGNFIKINSDTNKDLVTKIVAGSKGTDCLILLGKPLKEPILFQGSFVQAEESKLRRSYKIFNDDSIYWDHSVNDRTYIDHINNIKLQDRIKREIDLEIENERYM